MNHYSEELGYSCHFCEDELRRDEGVFCRVKLEIWQMCSLCAQSRRVKKELPRSAVLYRLEDGVRKQVVRQKRKIKGRKGQAPPPDD